MRILITTFTYPPNKDGVAEACRALAEGLADLGWEVCVATDGRAEVESTPSLRIMNGVQIHYFKFGDYSVRKTKETADSLNYQEFARNGRFDIVVNQCWDVRATLDLEPIMPSLRVKRVLVSHGYAAHAYQWHPSLTMGLGKWLRGLNFTFRRFPKSIKAYDKLIFLSPQKGIGRFFDHTIASLMQHPGIETIANGVDLAQFQASDEGFRQCHGIGDAPMALCVANYCDRKNQRLAVEAFRKANVPGSVLVCIGSELNAYGLGVVQLDELLQKSYPACRVLLLEHLSREETFAAFTACDLVLLAAKAETQPIVLIEAMAAGKPWISTNTGCVATMAGGLVCKRKSHLVEAIRKLLLNHALRVGLGSQGRHQAENQHDIKNNVARFDSIFRELAHRPA